MPESGNFLGTAQKKLDKGSYNRALGFLNQIQSSNMKTYLFSLIKYRQGYFQESLDSITELIGVTSQSRANIKNLILKCRILRKLSRLDDLNKTIKDSQNLILKLDQTQNLNEETDYKNYLNAELDSIYALTIDQDNEKRLKILLDSYSVMSSSMYSDNYELVQILMNISYDYIVIDDYQNSEFYSKKAIDLSKTNNNVDSEAYSKLVYAIGKHQQMLWSESLEILDQILPIFKENGNIIGEGSIYGNFSLIYSKIGQFELANEFGKKSLPLQIKVGHKRNLAYSYASISKINLNLGFFEEAIGFQLRALDLRIDSKNKNEELMSHIDMGEIYLRSKQVDNSIKILSKALKIAKDHNWETPQSTISFLLIQAYIIKGKRKFQDEIKNVIKLSEEIASRSNFETIKLNHIAIKGIISKNNPRISEKFKSMEYFKQLIYNENIDIDLFQFAIYNLVEILFIEYSNEPSKEILDEITLYFEKLKKVVSQSGSVAFKIDMMILESIFVQFLGNYGGAKILLLDAQALCKEYNLSYHLGRVSLEIERMALTNGKNNAEKKKRMLNNLNILIERNEDRSMLYHDIKNLLSVNLNYTYLLLLENDLPENVKNYLSSIQSSGLDLKAMITEVLKLDKLDSGKYDVLLESIDLNHVFKEKIDFFKNFANQKQIGFHLSSKEGVKVLADELLLKRILDNLIKNAVDFSPINSTIKILSKLEEQVIIEILNEGNPIDPEFKEILFNKYESKKNLNPKSDTGLGLGLAFCQKAITLMNGSISVESPLENTDQGIKFSLKLVKA